jgi:hypothetical protein
MGLAGGGAAYAFCSLVKSNTCTLSEADISAELQGYMKRRKWFAGRARFHPPPDWLSVIRKPARSVLVTACHGNAYPMKFVLFEVFPLS